MQTFNEFDFSPSIKKALETLKFIKPTEVQRAAIPLAIEGKDIIACAETGSGKTGAYAIPMVDYLLKNTDKMGVILAPTRELAQQISDFVKSVIRYTDNIGIVSIVGGADMRKQYAALKKRPRIVVATPGRLTDHLKRGTVNLTNTGILILDEGDRMLDMGFAPQLDVILKFLPKTRQTMLFTATLPTKVQSLAQRYLSSPSKISFKNDSQPVSTILQTVIETTSGEKDDKLLDELNKRTGSIIVFAKTKRKTDTLADYLDSYGFDVGIIHGGKSQGQRNRAIKDFRDGRFRILCATDVAARGIDIPLVEHVVNYDIPLVDEDYVHRIGRTGRNGASGEAVSFVLPQERRTWNVIAKKYRIQGAMLDVKSEAGGRKRKPRPSRSERGYHSAEMRESGAEPRKRSESYFDKDLAEFDTPKRKSWDRGGSSRSEEGGFNSRPRREGKPEWKPRSEEGGFNSRPRREGKPEWKPRSEEGGFNSRPRREGKPEWKPRSEEGGFNSRPRREGKPEWKPRSEEGGFNSRPRREGKPEWKPRSEEGGFNSRPRREGKPEWKAKTEDGDSSRKSRRETKPEWKSKSTDGETRSRFPVKRKGSFDSKPSKFTGKRKSSRQDASL